MGKKTPIGILAFFSKIIDILTFTGLPIKKKLLLFASGSLLWLFITSVTGFIGVYFVNKEFTDMLNIIAPQEQAINTVIRKLRGANISVHKIVLETDKEMIQSNYIRARDRLNDCINILNALQSGGYVKDEMRAVQMTVDEYEIIPLSIPESHQYIRDAIKNINNMQSTLTLIQASQQTKPFRSEIKQQVKEYDILTNETVILMTDIVILHKKLWHDSQQMVEKVFKISLLLISLALICAVALSIIFGFLISKRLVMPINMILNRFHDFYAKGFSPESITVSNERDEIAYLSVEFKNLLDSIEDISLFKRLIEEDEEVEDIYERLMTLLNQKLEIHSIRIFEISTIKNTIRLATSIGKDDTYCSKYIINDMNICKVKRTGRVISSLEHSRICKYFNGEQQEIHACFPIMISGKVGVIVSWVTNMSDNSKIQYMVKKTLTYLNAAQPVIEGKRFLRALKEASIRDSLTGLYNRRFLEESSENIMSGIKRRNTTLGLLMCDIDFFKETNDKYGHDAGDMVLQETAMIIKTSIRASDYVIRFGGEEFLVMLIDVTKGSSENIAEKIRFNIQNTEFNIKGILINKTISVGISEIPLDTQNLWEAIKFADIALYKAKDAGRNKVLRFESSMWQEKRY